MRKKIKRNIYFKFYEYIGPLENQKRRAISSINMPKEYRRTTFRKKRKNRYHNLLNYGYSKLIGNLISLKHHYDKEKRLLKKVIFEEEWLNKFIENKEEKALYLIESLTIIENLNKKDLDYNNYLEELKEEIEACFCISQEQKIYLKKKYNI
ncbi:hypothetical protein [uncultured Fusobacterium sp.]|uniref:hypothetical protein n=1 Tax=uncultured Fusobacterium sp. TaxID=159267 RepID=UPI0025ECD7E1|nr:hypothetical protein [uncultured Fusobacterium sp.]